MARVSDDTTVHLAASTAGTALVLRAFGEEGASSHPLPALGSVVVGRGEDAQVRLVDRSLSRRHAIVHLGDEVVLEDLRSANGVKVAGRVLDPGERVVVAPGTPIELGTVVIVIQRAEPARASADDVPVRVLDDEISRVAASNISVLIRGETGAGKEVLAQNIHARSRRAKGPLLAINCGAFAESLLDSELFGHEKGAFTGAIQAKPGLLESANGGTLFLDEVGELPPTLQVKLLRVLEERQVRRVGALRSTKLDVRFVSATNRDLEAMTKDGRFREDLFFRLDGITLTVPPLRERKDEIEPLARRFLESFARAEGSATVKRLSPAAVAALIEHAWPGNVRELRNSVERAAVLARGDVLEPEHLFRRRPEPARGAAATAASDLDLPAEIEALERRRIIEALDACAGSQTRAAEILGIPRAKLMSRIKAYGIARPRKR